MESYPPLPAPAKPPVSPLRWIGLVAWTAAFALLVQLMQNAWIYAPIPGTRVWLGAGVSALLHVMMIILLLVSWRLAHVGEFRAHGRIQTTVVMVSSKVPTTLDGRRMCSGHTHVADHLRAAFPSDIR